MQVWVEGEQSWTERTSEGEQGSSVIAFIYIQVDEVALSSEGHSDI